MDTLNSRIKVGKIGEDIVIDKLRESGLEVKPRGTELTGDVLKDAVIGDLTVEVDGVKTLIDVKMGGSISERSSNMFQGDYFAFVFQNEEDSKTYLIPTPVMKSYLNSTIRNHDGKWQRLPSGDKGWKFTHNNISGIRKGITLEDWIERKSK